MGELLLNLDASISVSYNATYPIRRTSVAKGCVFGENGRVAQLGERYNRTVEVEGSNPSASTAKNRDGLTLMEVNPSSFIG